MDKNPGPSLVGIATKYGLIQGALWFVIFVSRTLAAVKQNWLPAALEAAVALVLIVLAHREFKNRHAGMMKYSQGLGTGTLLSALAALLTSVLVYFYVRYINAGYLLAERQADRAALAQRGITGAQAQHAIAISSAIMTPIGVSIIFLVTGVIIGFIVALIVSIFTQKGDPNVVI